MVTQSYTLESDPPIFPVPTWCPPVFDREDTSRPGLLVTGICFGDGVRYQPHLSLPGTMWHHRAQLEVARIWLPKWLARLWGFCSVTPTPGNRSPLPAESVPKQQDSHHHVTQPQFAGWPLLMSLSELGFRKDGTSGCAPALLWGTGPPRVWSSSRGQKS